VTRIRDHEIHALEYGVGDTTIVLLHGLSGSGRWWARNAEGLASEFRVLVPDLIGFGRSRPVRALPTIDEIALLVLEWLRTMDATRVHLVGHSMGGQISVHLAAHAPEMIERLVLVDSAGIPRRFTPAALVRFAVEAGPIWRWGDPSFVPVIVRDALTAGPRVILRSIYNIVSDDVRDLLPALDLPTLIVWGERDTLVPLADAWEFRRLLPRSQLAILRAAGHNPMIDRPADFNRLITRFLHGETVGR
jgi:pimeloyl-ACP methyl ester carboxylesterase